MIGQLNLTLWAWLEAFRAMRKNAIWPPLALLFSVNCLGLLLLTEFHRPLIAWFMGPILRAMAPASSLHYPGIFLDLPLLFSRINVAVDLLLGAWVFGVVWLIAWKLATGVDPRGSWREARQGYFKLVVLRAPVSLLPLLLAVLLPRLLPAGDDGIYSALSQRILRFGTFIIGVCVESLVLFAPAALLLQRRSIGGAFADTFRMMGRAPLAVLLVVFVPNCVNLIIDYAVRHRDTIVFKMAPEWMGLLMLVAVAAYTVVSFFVISSAVRIWGARGVGREGGRA